VPVHALGDGGAAVADQFGDHAERPAHDVRVQRSSHGRREHKAVILPPLPGFESGGCLLAAMLVQRVLAGSLLRRWLI